MAKQQDDHKAAVENSSEDDSQTEQAKQTEQSEQSEQLMTADDLLDLDISLDAPEDASDNHAMQTDAGVEKDIDDALTELLEEIEDSSTQSHAPAHTATDVEDALHNITLDNVSDDELQSNQKEHAAASVAMTEDSPIQEIHAKADSDRNENSPKHASADSSPAETSPQESVSSLEDDIAHLTDWNDDKKEPEAAQQPAQETDHDKPVQDKTSAPVAAAEKPRTNFSIPTSIILSIGIIAILVAALAIWLSLGASQQATALSSAPKNLQQQIKLLAQKQDQQMALQLQQIETLQQQLNALTQVVASKSTQQWQSAIQASPTKKTAANSSQPDQAGQNKAKTAAIVNNKLAVKQAQKKVQPKSAPKAQKKTNPVIVSNVASKTANIKPAPLSRYEVAAGTVKGWIVNISSLDSKKAAEMEVSRLIAKDIKAEFVRVPAKGKIWYRTRVSGFENERAAITFKKFIKEYHGIKAWHQKLK